MSNLVNRYTVKHLLILNEVNKIKIPPNNEIKMSISIVNTINEKYLLQEDNIFRNYS
jgi:hypothetical protein